MRIGGFQRFSLADFPGHISAILFTLGCGFRCPYCHNPELVDPERAPAEVPFADVLRFLDAREGRVDGVVVTGGEPTLQADLPETLAALKLRGLAVKLDTNGTNPRMLGDLLDQRLLDYIAMDIKAPLAHYARLVRAPVAPDAIRRSIALIRGCGIEHEFRTTYVESLLSVSEMTEIAALVAGCRRFMLQRFEPTKPLDASLLDQASTSEASLQQVKKAMEEAGVTVSVR